MSRVVRTLAWPAMHETSGASSFQVNKAVVQNTCRTLCQVHRPPPTASRQSAAKYPGWRTLRQKLDEQVLPLRRGEDQSQRVIANLLLGEDGFDAGGEPFSQMG